MSALFEHVKMQVAAGITSGRFAVGDLLPSVDELAGEHNCSTGTVERALTELATAGVLKRVRKKGTIVARRPPLGRVCLLLSADDHTNTLLQHVVFEALHKAGFEVEVSPSTVEPAVLEDQVNRICERGDSTAVLVSLDERSFEPRRSILNSCFKLQVRFGFGAGVQAVADGAAGVGPDLRDMSRQIARHLISLGHRRIAVFGGLKNESSLSWPAFSATTLKDMFEMAGGHCFVHAMTDGEQDLLDLIRNEGVTAYWAINDHEAMCWETRLLREGISVPQQVSIIGRWDTPWASLAPTPLTSPSIDPPAVAQAIAQQAIKLVRGKKITSPVAVPTQLVVRDSTAVAPVRSDEQVSP